MNSLKPPTQFLIFYLFFCPTYGTESAGGLSFLNIPASSLSTSLGNTITSDMGSPSAMLQNPANIWQYPRWSFIFNYKSQNSGLGSNYMNTFIGYRRKQLSICTGFISYGVSKIEQYDEEAHFVNYFDFLNYAIPVGISLKTSHFLWGIGANYIGQRFTKMDYDKESFLGFDVGVSVIELLSKYDQVDITVSYVNKMIYSVNEKNFVSTAFGNSIFGCKVEIYNWLAIHTDFVFNAGTEIKNMRLGGQAYWRVKNVKLALNAGYNKVPIGSPNGINYTEYLKYSGKKSLGGFIEFPIPRANNASVQFAFSYELHPIFNNARYFSISFSI